MLEAHFGVPAAGGILVTVNTRLSSDEIAYILEHSGSRVLLLDAELAGLVDAIDLGGVHVIRVDDTGAPDDPYEQLLAGASPERPESRLEDEEETISINYTSGTTGRPKGVQYTYRGAYLNALNEAIVAGLSPESVFLWLQPMFHCNGWCFTWAVTAVGGRHVTIRTVDPDLIWDLVDAEGVTNFNGAPTVQLMVINHAEGTPRRASGDSGRRRGAAFAHALRAHGRAELPGRPRLRPDGDLRPDHGVSRAGGVARAAGGRAGRAPRPSGSGVPLGRPRAGRGRRHERRAA